MGVNSDPNFREFDVYCLWWDGAKWTELARKPRQDDQDGRLEVLLRGGSPDPLEAYMAKVRQFAAGWATDAFQTAILVAVDIGRTAKMVAAAAMNTYSQEYGEFDLRDLPAMLGRIGANELAGYTVPTFTAIEHGREVAWTLK